MSLEQGSEELRPGVDDYITFAESLCLRCAKLEKVHGIGKFERKINAEVKFLKSLKKEHQAIRISHLKSSNLSHFSSLLHAAERLPLVTRVLRPFPVPSRVDSLVIDIVACGGGVWVKVIARKAQALHLVWAGHGQFGERDLLSQAKEYLECAKRQPHEFRTPEVHFAFYSQVTQPMADALKELGVFVWGEIVPVEENVQAKLESVALQENDSDDSNDEYKRMYPQKTHEFPESQYKASFLASDRECEKSNLSFEEEEEGEKFANVTHYHPGNETETKSTTDQLTDKLCHISPDSYHPSKDTFMPTPSYTPCPCGKTAQVAASAFSDVCEKYNNSPTERVLQNMQTVLEESSKKPCSSKLVKSSSVTDLFLQLVSSPPDFSSLPTNRTALTKDQSVSSISRVNLDITTLIALVSSVTNGNCHLVFRDKVLTQQAKEEREYPVLPVLQEYLKGKEIFVCETAVSSFHSILEILGGPTEKKRAAELLSRVCLVKDQPSQRTLAMASHGRIKERSKVVFGTGDTLQAVTVSSNMGFVRAANSQGVVFPVFLHPARALTEEKEQHATPL